MSYSNDHIEQETHSKTVPYRTLTALGRTTALALLGITLIFLFLFVLFWVTSGQVILPVLALVLVFASTAGFVATGARFSELVLIYTLAVIALVAGIAATIQNYRSTERVAPRWLGSLLAGLSGLAIGMIVVALLVAASPQSISASTTTGGMPTVHMAGSDFLTNVLLVPKGEKLLLVDDDSVEHIIQNGSWTQSGTPQSQAEPGAPVVRNPDIKGGSVAIGPFTTAGVFHLYCTIHRGMNLTVLVQ